MKFNTQVCTTREQSERLLALGLKKETADMVYTNASLPYNKDLFHVICKEYKQLNKEVNYEISPFSFIPAWSLDRLIAMIPDRIYADGNLWNSSIQSRQVEYSRVDSETIGYKKSLKYFGEYEGSLYDSVVQCIEWLIKNKHFNEEYLEETK